MTYEGWAATVPQTITGDPVWRVQAYRLALFVGDLAWRDATCLVRDRRTLGISDQLYRAVGAVSPDIAEGFSRGTGKDRARFYEYALGSAREGRDWYYKGRYILGQEVVDHRMCLLTQVARLLLTMIPDQRAQVVREQHTEYCTSPDGAAAAGLDILLSHAPMPPE